MKPTILGKVVVYLLFTIFFEVAPGLLQTCLAAPFQFEPTGSLANARSDHSATLLSNGKVLVAGGTNGTTTLGSAELYDLATGIWNATGSLNTPRTDHAAVMLGNGKVLAIAGTDTNGNALTSAELYDPVSGSWSS